MLSVFQVRSMLGGILILLTLSSSNAADSAGLKYKWEKGQQFAYRIKIDIKLENYSEILTGVEQYSVIDSNADGFSLRCTGRLNSRTKSTSKQVRIHPMRLHRHHSPFAGLTHSMSGVFEQHVINVNRYGEIITVKGSSLLPYLIGNLSEINLIPLSPEGNTSWNESEKKSISIISNDRFPQTLGSSNVEKTMGAKETTDYKITGQTADEVTLESRHSYRTIAVVDGNPEVELSGTGKILFDKKQGCVKSLTLNYKLFRRSESTVHKFPITITSIQLTESELKKMKAEQEELQKKHAALKKKHEEASKFEIPENIEADLKNILSDLATDNVFKRKSALKRLSLAKPKKANPEISSILIKIMKSGDLSVASDASKALVVWSTKADIPALIELLPQVNFLGSEAVMESILVHKTPEGIQAVALLLKEPGKSQNASKKLISYGSGAEDAVLAQLDPSNFSTLVHVLRVLKEIGTEKSLKKIDEISKSTDNRSFQFHSASTVKAIEARVKK